MIVLSLGGLAPTAGAAPGPVGAPAMASGHDMPCCRGTDEMRCCAAAPRVRAGCTCSVKRQDKPAPDRRLAVTVVEQARAWVPTARAPEDLSAADARSVPRWLPVDRPTFLSSWLC